MTVGLPIDKNIIDARAGGLVLALRDTLREIQGLKAFFDAKTDPELLAFGYTAPEVAILRSSFTDLNKLALIAVAGATQSPASDFFFNARLLLGFK